MAHDRRDYTEVTYSTRDEVTVGFYQAELKQQGYIGLGSGNSLMFFRVEALEAVRNAVVQARHYVEIRRKAWDSPAG